MTVGERWELESSFKMKLVIQSNKLKGQGVMTNMNLAKENAIAND